MVAVCSNVHTKHINIFCEQNTEFLSHKLDDIQYINMEFDTLFQLSDRQKYRVILSVLDPRKCEYLKDYSLDFEHAYMTTYLAS